MADSFFKLLQGALGALSEIDKALSADKRAGSRPLDTPRASPRPGADAGREQARQRFLQTLSADLTAAHSEGSRERDAIGKKFTRIRRRLETERSLLLADPASEPLLDEAVARQAFTDARATLETIQRERLANYDALRIRYEAEAHVAAARFDPSGALGREWASVALKQIKADATRVERFIAADAEVLGRAEAGLAAFRLALAERTEPLAAPQLPRDHRLFDVFRAGMELEPADLTAIADVAMETASDLFRAVTAMSHRELLDFTGSWHKDGLPEDRTALIAEAFEYQALHQILQQMGYAKATQLAAFAWRSESRELLEKVPNRLARFVGPAAERLVRGLVLTSECTIPPISFRQLRGSIETLELPPVDIAGETESARLYRSWIERLEASALLTIGSPARDRQARSFAYEHFSLLAKLRTAVGATEPSAALDAWESHLGRRSAARRSVIERVSPFWRSILEALIDRPGVSDREQDGDYRAAFGVFEGMDEAGKAIVLKEAKALLETVPAADLGLAGRADGLRSVKAEFLDIRPRQVLTRLVQLLESSPMKRALFFAAPPSMPELSAFADYLRRSRKRDENVIAVDLAPLLVAGRFEEAEVGTRNWIARAPASRFRDALLAMRWQELTITDWLQIDAWVADPQTAAIGIDLSDHVEIAAPEDLVPFEISQYHRDAFHGLPALDPETLRGATQDLWRGAFDDCRSGLQVAGLASAYLVIRQHLGEIRGDWPEDLTHLHRELGELGCFWCFVLVNRLIDRALQSRRWDRSLPFLVGVHDFGTSPAVPQFASGPERSDD